MVRKEFDNGKGRSSGRKGIFYYYEKKVVIGGTQIIPSRKNNIIKGPNNPTWIVSQVCIM